MLDAFKQQASRSDAIALDIVRRFITTGTSMHVAADAQHRLRQRVHEEFGIRHQEIMIVGSAHLGFSIAPKKRWRIFNEESDIDLALVSATLYKDLWFEIADLQQKDQLYSWPQRSQWRKNHGRGWLRPDAFPPSPALPRRARWFEFFNEVSRDAICGPYKVTAGLYYDMDFLELYQAGAVQECMDELRTF